MYVYARAQADYSSNNGGVCWFCLSEACLCLVLPGAACVGASSPVWGPLPQGAPAAGPVHTRGAAPLPYTSQDLGWVGSLEGNFLHMPAGAGVQ